MDFPAKSQPCKMKTKSRAATSTKSEKKMKLVELRLAMLEQELTPQPLEMIKSTSKTKGSVRRSKEPSSSESSAMKRAEEFHANLSTEHPSFVKYMLRSHISSCFWLGLPSKFCDDHLPISDKFMELIDESGERTRVKYLAAKNGLSGGWRGFSIAHNLEEGDVLVFQLVQSTTFEVYIIRRNALGETDGALGLLGLDTRSNLILSNDDDDDDKDSYEQGKILPVSGFGSSSSEGISSEVLDCVKLSKTEQVNLESYEKFRILLDGSVSIDAMFPDHTRRKYYELCSKQNSCLHSKLQKEKNRTLVIGIINETINISDAIKASEHSSRIPENDELLAWDRTLQSFQMLGMNVGSIRMQIHRLMERALECEETAVLEAKVERELASEKMKNFESKLLELMDHMEEIDDEIERMEESTKRKRLKLREMETSSPSFV